MRSGVYVVGRLAGYITQTSKFNDVERVKHLLGVYIENIDKFGGVTGSLLEITVKKDFANGALISKVDSLKGKEVSIRVSLKEWSLDSGQTGISYIFDENSVIEELEDL